MKNPPLTIVLLALASIPISPHAVAADKLPAFNSIHTAGPDFAVQGEYVGTVGGTYPVGIQVMALGNGAFEGIVHGGGLPGAGWDGPSRFYLKGQRDGKTTRLEGVHGLGGHANFDAPQEGRGGCHTASTKLAMTFF